MPERSRPDKRIHCPEDKFGRLGRCLIAAERAQAFLEGLRVGLDTVASGLIVPDGSAGD